MFKPIADQSKSDRPFALAEVNLTMSETKGKKTKQNIKAHNITLDIPISLPIEQHRKNGHWNIDFFSGLRNKIQILLS